MTSLTSSQKKIYKKVNDILWKEWDPIGMNQVGPKDEYESYVPQIVGLLFNNASVQELEEKLFELEQEVTGLKASSGRAKSTAQKLMEAKNKM